MGLEVVGCDVGDTVGDTGQECIYHMTKSKTFDEETLCFIDKNHQPISIFCDKEIVDCLNCSSKPNQCIQQLTQKTPCQYILATCMELIQEIGSRIISLKSNQMIISQNINALPQNNLITNVNFIHLLTRRASESQFDVKNGTCLVAKL